MLLHKQHAGARPVEGDTVNAVANLSIRVRDALGFQSTVDWPPRFAGVVGAEDARGRDGDEDPLGICRVQNDGVQAHSASAWLPVGP